MIRLAPVLEQQVRLLSNPTLLRWGAVGWGGGSMLPRDEERRRNRRDLKNDSLAAVGRSYPGLPLEQLDRLLEMPEQGARGPLGIVGQCLDALADRYVCFQHGRPVARRRYLNELQEIKLRLVVEHLACWKVAKVLAESSPPAEPAAVWNLPWLDWGPTLGVQHHNLARRLESPLLDNHVHLGGVLSTLDLWVEILDPRLRSRRLRELRRTIRRVGDEPLQPLVLRRLERARVLRDLLGVLVRQPGVPPPEQLPSPGRALELLQEEVHLEGLLGLAGFDAGYPPSPAATSFADRRPIPFLLSPTREELRRSADRSSDASLVSERSLLVRSFCTVLAPNQVNSWIAPLLTVYLVSQNLFHQAVTQQGHRVGLGHFLEWYEAPARGLRSGIDPNRQVRVLERVTRRGRDRVEGRITPEPEVIRSWIDAFEASPFLTDAQLGRDFGLVCHFIKEPETRLRRAEVAQEEPGEMMGTRLRHRALRTKVRRQSFALERLRLMKADAAQAVVAIDAARGEGDAPPAVFAPAFRFLRRPLPRRPAEPPALPGYGHEVPHLGATFHVGESFDHPLTGLRGVHETVRFLDLRPGDRIGHGLALGLDPGRWLDACGAPPLTTRENLLDDLIWTRWMLEQLGRQDLVSSRMVDLIHGLTDALYGDRLVPAQASIYDLAWAWRLRWMDPEDLFAVLENFGWRNGLPPPGPVNSLDQRLAGNLQSCRQLGRCQLWPGPDSGDRSLCAGCGEGRWSRSPAVHDVRLTPQRRVWRLAALDLDQLFSGAIPKAALRYLWCYSFDPVYFQRGLESTPWPDDLEWQAAFRVLQEAVIREVAKRVVTVEACPTSNQSIGGLGDLRHHPIFRLSPPGGENGEPGQPRVQVIVCSDDPGIFATDLRWEFAALAQAAEESGYEPAVVLAWIDHLRAMAEETTFLRGRGLDHGGRSSGLHSDRYSEAEREVAPGGVARDLNASP